MREAQRRPSLPEATRRPLEELQRRLSAEDDQRHLRQAERRLLAEAELRLLTDNEVRLLTEAQLRRSADIELRLLLEAEQRISEQRQLTETQLRGLVEAEVMLLVAEIYRVDLSGESTMQRTEPFRERVEPTRQRTEPTRQRGEPSRERGEPTRQRTDQQIYGPPQGLRPWTDLGEPTRQRTEPPRQRTDQPNYRSYPGAGLLSLGVPGVPPQISADQIFRPSYGPAGEPANDRELRLYLEAQTRRLSEAQPTRQRTDQQIYWTPQGMGSFGPGELPIHLSTQEEIYDSDEFTANS